MTKKPVDRTVMPYVITGGDEGIQINVGQRLAFAGSGLGLEGFSQVVKLLKVLFKQEIRIAAAAQSDWIKEKMRFDDWDQVNAAAQQQIEALAVKEGLLYSGFLPFADPRELKEGVKGHMVRPKDVHIANKISFTLGGTEQVYNLGCFVISADWVHLAKKDLVKKVILPQIKFYTKISGLKKLELVFEETGPLGEKVATKNKKMLASIGVK